MTNDDKLVITKHCFTGESMHVFVCVFVRERERER